MKYVVVCVRDIVADVYTPPNFAQGSAAAVRGFGDQVNRADPQNLLYAHPGDFELYELGTFDDATAAFEIHDKPRRLVLARDLVRDEAKVSPLRSVG